MARTHSPTGKIVMLGLVMFISLNVSKALAQETTIVGSAPGKIDFKCGYSEYAKSVAGVVLKSINVVADAENPCLQISKIMKTGILDQISSVREQRVALGNRFVEGYKQRLKEDIVAGLKNKGVEVRAINITDVPALQQLQDVPQIRGYTEASPVTGSWQGKDFFHLTLLEVNVQTVDGAELLGHSQVEMSSDISLTVRSQKANVKYDNLGKAQETSISPENVELLSQLNVQISSYIAPQRPSSLTPILEMNQFDSVVHLEGFSLMNKETGHEVLFIRTSGGYSYTNDLTFGSTDRPVATIWASKPLSK